MHRFVSLIFLAMLLASCATMDENKKEQRLAETLLFYEKAIRWAEFSASHDMRRLPDDASPADPATLEGIRVTRYKEVGRRNLADGNEIEIAVRIDFYNDSTLKVSSIIDQQHWRYDEAGDSWHITTPLPAFR